MNTGQILFDWKPRQTLGQCLKGLFPNTFLI